MFPLFFLEIFGDVGLCSGWVDVWVNAYLSYLFLKERNQTENLTVLIRLLTITFFFQSVALFVTFCFAFSILKAHINDM